ncbi:mediator of RNA polymerase II transcription subunit 1 isoform X2 [Quillaja saponaria]|uniref:Mediator of RNA polymerase II transcription subunit 1 isoform X2 n=1 Tax=Quillaja saponaria TaxID=32244 RepID=A0AAD7PSV4_QUISA|nr:mediator of RNA polymerase II transcription subunit 1 isoform X2 [Quillaja saponaria]KAJ7965626.1 mediator of RNA polymerase II transcription subunit 1 isoform X2 [Quillaja saponaria]
MERSEPTLVPEWLRSAGNVTGGGSSVHHFPSSSSHTDASLAHHTRNRNSKNSNDFDGPRSAFLERSSSSNSRRSSSNGSSKHAYSSFNRSHRDKDRDREKERSSFGDHWDRDSADPLANIFPGRVEKDALLRSHSMVSRKQNELLPRRVAVDAKTSSNSNHNNGNGALSGGTTGSGIQKAVFEKDFPSLGSEERQGIPDIVRVSSPGLTTAGQNLPVGSSTLIGGEGWTSALAEVPAIIGSSSSGSVSVQQTVIATSASAAPSAMAGLNMAEALTQAPARARTAPQLSVKTQRLEELAIKQSRQLIPVTPSLPKASVHNSSEKSKPKMAVRNVEMNVASKTGSQQSSPLLLANQTIRSVNVKLDTPKTSGKFLVLGPMNGVSPTSKDVASPTNNANSRPGHQLPIAPPVASVLLRSPNNNQKPITERKAASLDLKSGSTLEKRPSISQVQSRNDFFNLIKKKTSMSTSDHPDSAPVVSSPTMGKSGEVTREILSGPASHHALENGVEVISNGDVCEEICSPSGEEKGTNSAPTVYPDEEEAAFLRSLGWEENSGEDEGLTEEEINAFYQEYMKLRPSFKLQPKLSKLSKSPATNLDGASAELSSSDSGSEA